MKPLFLLCALAFTACAPLTSQQTVLVNAVTAVAVTDLCTIGSAQFAKVGNPTTAQSLAKGHLDVVCADPNATANLITSSYNQLATVIGASKAKVVK